MALSKAEGLRCLRSLLFAIPENSKPRDLLRLLGIPEREVMLVVNPRAREHVLALNDVSENRNTIPLKTNDTIRIYPFLAVG
jgi:hypothetical protein